MQNPLIIANLKTYLSNVKHVFHLQESVWQHLHKEKYSYLLAVPATMLYQIVQEKYKAFKVGAQNVDTIEEGAHTGAVNVEAVLSAGASFTILGHSEVRETGETSGEIAEKVGASLQKGLSVVLCIGEKSRKDSDSDYLDDIKDMLAESLQNVDRRAVHELIVAYEPVWAIGAPKPATSEQTLEAVIQIRRTLAQLFGLDNAKKIKILYGGAVTADGVAQFVNEAGVDGVLVGRAALNPKEFADIVNSLYEG